jgi:hypothetical protein
MDIMISGATRIQSIEIRPQCHLLPSWLSGWLGTEPYVSFVVNLMEFGSDDYAGRG